MKALRRQKHAFSRVRPLCVRPTTVSLRDFNRSERAHASMRLSCALNCEWQLLAQGENDEDGGCHSGKTIWVDVSDIFYFFSARGGVRGVRGAGRGWGEDFLLKMPGGGGVSRAGLEGAEGPGGCPRGIRGGGGAKYFFSCRNSHQAMVYRKRGFHNPEKGTN